MKGTTWKRWGLLAAAVAGLGGCAAPTPPLTLPAAPVAPAFPNAASSPQSGLKAASTTGWQAYFPDPSLRQVIGQALANNRDLRVAVLNIEAARAVLGQRRADLWPTLNAGASAVRGTGAADLKRDLDEMWQQHDLSQTGTSCREPEYALCRWIERVKAGQFREDAQQELVT